MCSKWGRWMEEKKRVVPREVCMESSENGNRYREITLNVQKSADVIVAESFIGEGLNQQESLVQPGKEE